MVDASKFHELKIAPRAVFDSLAERRTRVRFMVPTADGDYRAVTWGAFANEIRELALFLSARGLKMGDRAAIYAGNRVEWMSAALAIQAAGGVMVPIYPSSTTEQTAYVVEHSDAKVLFVDGKALLARLFESAAEPELGALRAVEAIVLLDDGLDAMAVLADVSQKLRAAGKDAPSSRSGRRDALHERHLRQPQGRSAHAPQRGRQRPRLARLQRAAVDEGAVDLLWLPMSHIFGFGEACLGNTLGFTTTSRPGDGAREAPRGEAERVHERAERLGEARDARVARGSATRGSARRSSPSSRAGASASASPAARASSAR
jgi:long-chain acyl-CoA synthetase